MMKTAVERRRRTFSFSFLILSLSLSSSPGSIAAARTGRPDEVTILGVIVAEAIRVGIAPQLLCTP